MEQKKYYEVTIERTGVVFVMASSEDEAMDIANHQRTGSVSWSDDWQPTAAEEIEYDPNNSYADGYEWK